MARRFTCAHEIGHFVKRSIDLNNDDFEYVDLRGPLASQGLDDDEIYANEFAGCLLMPESTIREKFREGLSVPELSFIFKVSSDAVVYRLKNLELVN